MLSERQPNAQDADELETTVGQTICGGDLRATIGALIVANDYLESEVAELKKAVSHAYVRGDSETMLASRHLVVSFNARQGISLNESNNENPIS